MPNTLRDKSGKLFPKANDRLTVLAGVGRLEEPATFSTSGLAGALDLPEPKVSKELMRLREVGLVEDTPNGASHPMRRVPSGFWIGCVSLHDEWSSDDSHRSSAGSD